MKIRNNAGHENIFSMFVYLRKDVLCNDNFNQMWQKYTIALYIYLSLWNETGAQLRKKCYVISFCIQSFALCNVKA